MGILTYSPLSGGWLSGQWTADSTPTSPARQRLAARFDMSLPENQRKLEAVQQLARRRRRRRRSPCSGPGDRLLREPSAAGVTLNAPSSTAYDEIVRPGVNLNPADTSYGEQITRRGYDTPRRP